MNTAQRTIGREQQNGVIGIEYRSFREDVVSVAV
jgi:hypothetical protein